MARRTQPDSIDSLVRAAMADVVARAAQDIASAIAALAAEELTKQLEISVARPARGVGTRRPARRLARREMTRWVADRRARRVPNFVIDLTGLKTKKQIVARYGADVAFEKGKATPKPRG